jgi:hypothetical protein
MSLAGIILSTSRMLQPVTTSGVPLTLFIRGGSDLAHDAAIFLSRHAPRKIRKKALWLVTSEYDFHFQTFNQSIRHKIKHSVRFFFTQFKALQVVYSIYIGNKNGWKSLF